MDDHPRRVLRSGESIGTLHGIDVTLDEVELLPSGVLVRIAGVESETTRRLDAEFAETFAAWAEVRRNRGKAAAGRAPDQPGTRLNELPIALADDLGTEYSPQQRSAAGSGTEWLAEVQFEPAVPHDALVLTVVVDSPGAVSTSREFALGGS
jgi:hypothetical protein